MNHIRFYCQETIMGTPEMYDYRWARVARTILAHGHAPFSLSDLQAQVTPEWRKDVGWVLDTLSPLGAWSALDVVDTGPGENNYGKRYRVKDVQPFASLLPHVEAMIEAHTEGKRRAAELDFEERVWDMFEDGTVLTYSAIERECSAAQRERLRGVLDGMCEGDDARMVYVRERDAYLLPLGWNEDGTPRVPAELLRTPCESRLMDVLSSGPLKRRVISQRLSAKMRGGMDEALASLVSSGCLRLDPATGCYGVAG